MRKLAPLAAFLLVVTIGAATGAALSSCSKAWAADFPALGDGGSIVTPADAGFYHCATSANARYRKNGWNAVVRCSPFGVYYVACETASCVPTVHNQYLTENVTYDIGMPGGLDTLCIKTFDGGVPSCTLNYKRDRGE